MKKIATGFISASLLLASVVPAFAVVDVTISGNGKKSENTVTVEEKCKTQVTQKNKTIVDLSLTQDGTTGNNTQNGNTGTGDKTITTGAVSNTLTVTVNGGNNDAKVPPCCCADEDPITTLVIKNNGEKSVNEVSSTSKKKLKVRQRTRTKVDLTGTQTGDTGNNEQKSNTGAGNVDTTTKNVTNTGEVTVTSGSNTLDPS